MVQLAAVLGAVTVTAAGASVDGTSEVSDSVGSADQLTLTRACDVTDAGISPEYVPVVAVALAMPLAIGVQVVPPSALNAISTVWPAGRLWLQVIVRVEPAPHVTAVFGAVTITR